LIAIIEEQRYQSMDAYRLGKKVPNSNVRTYGKGMCSLYVFLQKWLRSRKPGTLNPLLYDTDLINDDVFLLLYPSLLLPELRFAL